LISITCVFLTQRVDRQRQGTPCLAQDFQIPFPPITQYTLCDSPQATKLDKRSALEARGGSGISIVGRICAHAWM